MTKPANICFDEIISMLRETDLGSMIESFIRVEYGECYLRAAWDAFKDIADFFDEEYLGDVAMLNQFLITLEDEVRFSDMGLPYKV